MTRDLAFSERCFHELGAGLTMNNLALLRMRGRLDCDALVEALVQVQRRHPALRVRVLDEPRPRFCDEGVPAIPLRRVARVDDDTWRAELRRELQTDIDAARGPLIRVVLVWSEQACELLCTTSHVNSDGRSLTALLADLLRVLDDPGHRLAPLPARPGLEDALGLGWWDALRLPATLRRAAAGSLAALGQGLASLADPREQRRAARRERAAAASRAPLDIVMRRIAPHHAAALLDACKSRGHTLQSVLVVACTHALARELAVERIRCASPVDARGLARPPLHDEFGLFSWAPWLELRSADDDVWRAIDRVAARLASLRSRPTLGMALVGAAWLESLAISPFDARLASIDRARHDASIVVSNIGRVGLPTRAAGLDIVDLAIFGMFPDVEFVVAAHGFRGGLGLDFCGSSACREPALVERIADRVVDVLTRSIAGA